MGGLRKAMPTTCWTFYIGTAALAGVCPLAGFWSKDEILLEVGFGELAHKGLFWMAVAAAFLTAFYMTRLCMLTFEGKHPRNPRIHAHESAPVMLWPLRILAFFAVILGLFGTPWANLYHHFVHFPAAHSPEPRLWLLGLSLGVAILGIVAGCVLYSPGKEGIRQKVVRPIPIYWLYCLWRGKYWLDEIWWAVLVVPMFTVMRALAWFDRQIVDGIVNFVGGFTVLLSQAWRLFDLYVVDGIVNAVGYVTKAFGEIGKFVQTGRVQSYALIVFICVFAMALVRILQLQ
jgi:NADH-quinone oxidoreductase subunit L